MSYSQAITLGNVSAGYSHREVVHSISCTIQGNRTTAIVGPGGSGKSTLLHAVGRPTRQDRQGFWFSGYIDGPLSRVSLLPQKTEACHESLADLLARWPHCGADPEGWVREFWRSAALPAGEILASLLYTPLSRLLHALRRLAEFTAAASNPAPVLLIDEPEMGTSERTRDWIASKLAAMRGRQTVILVTHHLGLARQTSDDAIFLLDGHLVEAGSTSSMFSQPRLPRTRALLTYGS